MAGPHVAGIVALMREACPDCDYITIKEAIMSTAIDAGYGPAGQDNQFGHGFIDGYAAVLSVVDLGRISGVADDGLNPLPGVWTEITPEGHSTLTNISGEYGFVLNTGTYSAEYSKFGYVTQSIDNIPVVGGDTTIQNVSLSLADPGIVSGTVTSCFGGPAVDATVEILDTPIEPTTTDSSGFYSFAVPQGSYSMRTVGEGCYSQTVSGVAVGTATTQNFTLNTDSRFECS
jgi:hypothetical protein